MHQSWSCACGILFTLSVGLRVVEQHQCTSVTYCMYVFAAFKQLIR